MNEKEFEEKRKAISDSDLIELCDKEISNLARTYGKSHKMSIPPMVTDTDMLLSELVRRYKHSLETIEYWESHVASM